MITYRWRLLTSTTRVEHRIAVSPIYRIAWLDAIIASHGHAMRCIHMGKMGPTFFWQYNVIIFFFIEISIDLPNVSGLASCGDWRHTNYLILWCRPPMAYITTRELSKAIKLYLMWHWIRYWLIWLWYSSNIK